MAKPRSPQAIDFEASMSELETLVEKLERGDLPLEESLSVFERGVALTRTCQSALAAAEQKVELLLRRPDAEPQAVPFGDAADAGDDPQ